MVFRNEFYQGSRALDELADLISLPIDQLNFLVCQVVALCLAFPFRTYCSTENIGATPRHVIETVVGLLLTLFCFGYQMWHLLAQSFISYLVMSFTGKRFSHTLVFAFSMIYLSVCHIYRQTYDYGGYTLDITGPLMIQTQKLTSLAFSLHDGRFKNWSSLKQDQKDQAVRKLPNILEYLSYLFYFHGVMVGPLTFYNDYIAFINGTSFAKPLPPYPGLLRKHPADGLNKVVIRKLAIALACCLSIRHMPDMFYTPDKLNTPEFYSMSFFGRMIFVLGVMSLAKHKYYFAWILADAVNNAAGFGFSGYNTDGTARWDLTDNVSIIGVEFGTSLKTNIESWNKKTQLWLRRVIYDRFPSRNTMAVFTCSAIWHGFYPGYYVTFMSGALLTFAARKVRRNIRPLFQETMFGFYTYEVITFIATRLANCYLTFPFLVLEFYICLNIYKSLYFYYHILASLALLYFAVFGTKPQRSESIDQSNMDQIASELYHFHRHSTSIATWMSPSFKVNDDLQKASNQIKSDSDWLNEDSLFFDVSRSASVPEMTLKFRAVEDASYQQEPRKSLSQS